MTPATFGATSNARGSLAPMEHRGVFIVTSRDMPGAGRSRALLVERQPVLVSFLRDMLERAGHDTVVAARSASEPALHRIRPDTVLIGPGAERSRPLAAIRRIRLERPDARLVVILPRTDELWRALALALGADVVLGPADDRAALRQALSRTPGGNGGQARLRRTS